MYDVIIVGGGPAGLSAAVMLGRCRRSVLLFDAGSPRNATSHAIHGFLTRDGTPPRDFLGVAREELRRYETVSLRDEVVPRRAVGGRGRGRGSGSRVCDQHRSAERRPGLNWTSPIALPSISEPQFIALWQEPFDYWPSLEAVLSGQTASLEAQ